MILLHVDVNIYWSLNSITQLLEVNDVHLLWVPGHHRTEDNFNLAKLSFNLANLTKLRLQCITMYHTGQHYNAVHTRSNN